MSTNRISATLSPEGHQAVIDAIATIRKEMPFLVDLSLEERKTLTKMGDRSRGFVDQAYILAMQNPDFLPRSFDLEEMKRDVELFRALHPLMMALNQLHELMEDTYMAAGSEAYSAALAVYSYAKADRTGLALDSAVKELSRRFARSRGRSEDSEEPVMENEEASEAL